MAATFLYNMARMTVTGTPGTGTITLNAAVSSFLTFAQAGVPDGTRVAYTIEDGANREKGEGVYTSSGTTLTRATIRNSTNSNAAISATSAAQVLIDPAATDILNKTGDTMTGKLTTLATATGAAGFNVPHGTAPTSPVDGDVWTTSAGGLYARINGVTVGPYAAGSASFSQVQTSGSISGGTTNVVFTSINSEDIKVVFNNVATSGSTTAQISISIDNGSTYTTTPISFVTAGILNTGGAYGNATFSGLKAGWVQGLVGGMTTVVGKDGGLSGGVVLTFNAGAQVNAIKITLTGGATFSSGTILLFGRG
jgi:hypothetical protein